MNRIGRPQRASDPAPALMELAAPRHATAGTLCRDWAEEHWEVVGMIASMLCAVTVAIILAVTFNVVSS